VESAARRPVGASCKPLHRNRGVACSVRHSRCTRRGDFSVLTLLDLSAVFDMVDHATLLRCFKTTYGITGTVLVWITSYLHEKKLSVNYRGSRSTPSSLLCGVAQESVLELILFLLYRSTQDSLMERSSILTVLWTTPRYMDPVQPLPSSSAF